MNLTPLLLTCALSGFVCAAAAEAEKRTTSGQDEILRFIREHDHVLTAIVYKREIIPDTRQKNHALEVAHALVIRTMKGNIPEGARIVWVRSQEALMNGAIYTHTIFPGKPFPYHIIGSVCGELKGGVKVLSEPVRITPLQSSFYTDFISLRSDHQQAWKQALNTPRSHPAIPMYENDWKKFEQEMETAAANDPENGSTSF